MLGPQIDQKSINKPKPKSMPTKCRTFNAKKIQDRFAARPPRPESGAKTQRCLFAPLFFHFLLILAVGAQRLRPQGPMGPPLPPHGIPKLFRIGSHSELGAIPNLRPFRIGSHSELEVFSEWEFFRLVCLNATGQALGPEVGNLVLR